MKPCIDPAAAESPIVYRQPETLRDFKCHHGRDNSLPSSTGHYSSIQCTFGAPITYAGSRCRASEVYRLLTKVDVQPALKRFPLVRTQWPLVSKFRCTP